MKPADSAGSEQYNMSNLFHRKFGEVTKITSSQWVGKRLMVPIISGVVYFVWYSCNVDSPDVSDLLRFPGAMIKSSQLSNVSDNDDNGT